MKLTAKCTYWACGRTFDASYSGFRFVNAKDITLFDNTCQCPYCGRAANVQEGRFSFDENGLIEAFNKPSFTPEVLEALKDVIKNAQQNQYSPEKFKSEAEKIDPAVKNLFLDPTFQAQWNMANTGLQTLFAFLTLILTVILPLVLDKKNENSQPLPPIHVHIEQPATVKKTTPFIKTKKPKIRNQRKVYDSSRKKKRGGKK